MGGREKVEIRPLLYGPALLPINGDSPSSLGGGAVCAARWLCMCTPLLFHAFRAGGIISQLGNQLRLSTTVAKGKRRGGARQQSKPDSQGKPSTQTHKKGAGCGVHT